jgi:hypothetical protein
MYYDVNFNFHLEKEEFIKMFGDPLINKWLMHWVDTF